MFEIYWFSSSFFFFLGWTLNLSNAAEFGFHDCKFVLVKVVLVVCSISASFAAHWGAKVWIFRAYSAYGWAAFSLLALITSSCLYLFSSFSFVLSFVCFLHKCPMLLSISHALHSSHVRLFINVTIAFPLIQCTQCGGLMLIVTLSIL